MLSGDFGGPDQKFGFLRKLAPRGGFEPPTNRLTAGCFTILGQIPRLRTLIPSLAQRTLPETIDLSLGQLSLAILQSANSFTAKVPHAGRNGGLAPAECLLLCR